MGLKISHPSVARSVFREHHFTADDIVTSKPRALQLQRLIFNAQSKAKQSFGQEWYITDRSGLDPLAYAHRYVGDEEAWLMPKSRDDGFEIQFIFCSLLDELGIQYTILLSSVQDLGSRVDFVIEQWRNR
ncbi:hypothetical protein JMJ35_008218 [Cladonia borealis]|uniref:NadR/Ttd14 AAA domain-containing protein n=1 Tax=Cladonia borealis TaxID=184061 RepID=A0AA39QXM6_9LECA|nr:hypothetical protein JMJ35_008218 [Cladonia borealis]